MLSPSTGMSVTGPQFISADDVGASPQMAHTNKQGVTPCAKMQSLRNIIWLWIVCLDPILRGVANSCVARGPMQHHCAAKRRSEIPEIRHSGDGEIHFRRQMAPGSPHSKNAQRSGILFNKASMYESDDRRQNDAMIW